MLLLERRHQRQPIELGVELVCQQARIEVPAQDALFLPSPNQLLELFVVLCAGEIT
ncbi:MAG: hypothetical protein QF921_15770 [Pseudomonadales bacterium]|jgi:hypothetical protein|nr:hypothetical protein [Pseudomonadales bacterium]MDP6471236.1 hypothetical protein [Pseudomonadales bacterium]MDP6825575.1 hypothetical protein [Pseudomonadales bacterium]MDP6972942.1 hypothetical protein [Pseudomonadales bacterium]|tara:strand:- start:2469 stop:2636 length:168 start_codon:yes stop_codon:yes gene_type:complete